MENELELRCSVELIAKPKETVVDALKRLVHGIEENGKKLEVSSESYSEPKLVEKDFYSAFATFNIKADFMSLVNFVLDYAPSSIEVLKPGKMEVSLADLQTTLNDISGRLNEMDHLIKLYSTQLLLTDKENRGLKGKPDKQ
jgi:hypothetical protein